MRIAVDLDASLQSFIEQEIADGRFQSAREVIEVALQLLQERESRLATLRSMMAQDAPPLRRITPPADRADSR